MNLMTKEEALEFKERWRIVNRFVSEEVRRTPPDVKARQIAAVFKAARALHLDLTQDDQQPFERWWLLKEKYNVG
jgi:hypothetical protein